MNDETERKCYPRMENDGAAVIFFIAHVGAALRCVWLEIGL